VSGLPGSGKSTLAQQLAPALGLPLLDKDTILERLFEAKGAGDLAWRRELSRESDLILRTEAIRSPGAVLVSHWRLPGMSPNSGTPTDWFLELAGTVVNVHCQCAPEIAAERFALRRRHVGHRDGERSLAEILASIREVAGMGELDLEPRVSVDTSRNPDLDGVLREVHEAFRRCAARIELG
jgi:glucokinase